MSSTYTLYPSSVADSSPARRDRMNEPRSLPSNDSQHISPSTPVAGTHLSAFSPQLRLRSSSSSPALNQHTPAESSTLSIHYQSSEFSEVEDPFFGINFGALDGRSPSFLDDDFLQLPEDQAPHHAQDTYLPLSPDKTPSLHTTSPHDRKEDRAMFPGPRQNRAAAQLLTNITTTNQPSISVHATQSGHQYTPENSGSGRSSEDGLAPAATTMMHAQSPRLTVSMWGRDGPAVPYPLDPDQHLSTFGDLSEDDGGYDADPASGRTPTVRDNEGRWIPDHATGQSGLSPNQRPVDEDMSINELAAKRKVEERNEEVGGWIERSATPVGPIRLPKAGETIPEPPVDVPAEFHSVPLREIDAVADTENDMKAGQLYINTSAKGELTEADVELIRRNRNWEAAPLPFEISRDRSQPETSQAAIEQFERLCKDTDSIVSKAATWGTRRRSLPSIIDVEGITSGNFLRKLTISRGEPGNRRPSLLRELRGLVRRPSNTMAKRPRDTDDAGSIGTDSSADRNPAQPGLAPPNRTMSWGKKQPVPSINTAILAVGSRAASIGTTHARSGSFSATPTITSPTPKSPVSFNLSVKKPTLGPLGRNRSKSDLTKSQSNLADMWKKTGGPPVAHLANPAANIGDADDEDDEDEDIYEDQEMRTEAQKMIDEITPNFAGFQQHILKLNPSLATTNTYLVDRIAHQQIVRYKSLLNAKVKHLQVTQNRNCQCGALCMDLGGSPNILDSRGDPRGLDPLSARFEGSDGDITPLEGPGVISPESFPPDIPMPPATILPAEFECQLCFQAKKFQKPSDWTKHVHEDVQPFTCTWDRCRDPKIFKRKADWVRHENEGHRHLEWWDCDVEDCRHVCYRRDNFLQHLVREHKYPEPKVKTKAAIKRAGGLDPTWQKVEQCHKETRDMPYNEPCRFCGKTFPTWKKLTVHLAKHMEQISLPILKLVQKKELEPDTIISPVQDPPPRPFPATFPVKSEPQYDLSPTNQPMARPMAYSPQQPQQPYMYSVVPPGFQGSMFGSYSGMSGMTQPPLSVQPPNPVGHAGFASLNMQPFPDLPVTSAGTFMAPYGADVSDFSVMTNNALGLQDPNVIYMDPNSAGTDFTPQGSVSPYGHSPHQGPGAFYG